MSTGQHRANSPLEQLLEEIKFQRRKELRSQVETLKISKSATKVQN